MSIQAISAAFALQGVSPAEKLLLIALANYADEHMQCWPSNKRLHRDTMLSERAIRDNLRELAERGLIAREPQKRPDGSRSADVITLRIGGAADAGGGADAAKPDPAANAGGGAPAAPGGAANAPLTTFEPPVNPVSGDKSPSTDAREFERFWEAYPSKVGKIDAAKAFKTARGAASLETMLGAIQRARTGRRWREGMIPNPATWLRQGRWGDEVASERAPLPAYVLSNIQ